MKGLGKLHLFQVGRFSKLVNLGQPQQRVTEKEVIFEKRAAKLGEN